MNEYGIRCGRKAVLWFVKDTRGDKETIVSDVMSGGREKDHHDWQQAESEAAYWINGDACFVSDGASFLARSFSRLIAS